MHMMRFGYFGGPGPGNGIGFFFFLLMMIFIAAVIFALLSATHHRDAHGHSRLSTHPHGPHADHHTAQDSDARKILDRRFAAGEIDEEEYLRRRTLLDGGS
jgi:putative membrane protein